MPVIRPSRPILTAAEMRSAEAKVVEDGGSLVLLMERAGAAVAAAVQRFAGGGPVLILCGKGNNGGDGYVAARLLREAGVAVRVAIGTATPCEGIAAAAARGWGAMVEPLETCEPAPVLVDALFGTGLSRPLDAALAAQLRRLAAAARMRVAIDLPSGVFTDDGRADGDLPAFDLTVALGALKPAHRLMPAASLCGRVLVTEIGFSVPSSPRLTEIAPPLLPTPAYDATKYSRGKLLVVAGAMPGAALLAGTAAQRAGAGYVEVAGAAGGLAPHALVQRPWDAHALADPRIGAIAIGPGLGLDDDARARLDAVLATARPLVLDADALTLIGRERHDRLRGHVVTPHWGEFVRLFGDNGDDRLTQARAAAAASGAVVLLKGADTIVAHPDGRAAINPPAPAWLASAGTGDVLTGIIGAMLAQGMAPFEAAQAGAWLHAQAARLAGPLLVADDLIASLAAAAAPCL